VFSSSPGNKIGTCVQAHHFCCTLFLASARISTKTGSHQRRPCPPQHTYYLVDVCHSVFISRILCCIFPKFRVGTGRRSGHPLFCACDSPISDLECCSIRIQYTRYTECFPYPRPIPNRNQSDGVLLVITQAHKKPLSACEASLRTTSDTKRSRRSIIKV